MKWLRNAGFNDVSLYDIDGNRPSQEEILNHFKRERPDVLGISAVVSTSYKAAKELAAEVRKIREDTVIVLGGPMGASAEIILNRTEVDAVVLGEGERPMVQIAQHLNAGKGIETFIDIPGLAVLNEDNELVNTGYSDPLTSEEIYDYDITDLESSSNIDQYFPTVSKDISRFRQYFRDPRAHEAHRRGKTWTNLITSKGCVAKCTYCHRWAKGQRILSLDEVFRRIDFMIERYNIGFFEIGDENFGADIKWLREFCERLKSYDLLWAVNFRVTRKDPELLDLMIESGCTEICFGLEAGSERMLQVMEKKASLQQNYDAVTWTSERNVFGAVALVIGMPGENNETIGETIEFCKYAQALDPQKNPNQLSCNFAQALPGTPLYEYARHKGIIGRGMDAEEEYLIFISDHNAHDEFTTLNFTDVPTLTCQTWRPRITVEVNYHYVQTHGLNQYHKILMNDLEYYQPAKAESGYYANPLRIIETSKMGDGSPPVSDTPEVPSLFSLIARGKWGLALVTYPKIAYRARHFLLILTILKNLKKFGGVYTIKLLTEWIGFQFKCLFGKKWQEFDYKSLRKMVNNEFGALSGDNPAMENLRKGR